MSWLKKFFTNAPQEPQQPLPKPVDPPAPDPNPELTAAIKEMVEDDRLRELRKLDDLRAAYGETLVMLKDRHILQIVDRNQIFERLGPPARRFTTEPLALNVMKILPPPEATFAEMERFWNNLRVFNQPLSLTLISSPERMFFRLTVPPGCGEATEQQLAIHFPTAVPLVPTEDERWIDKPLYCINLAPKFCAELLDHSAVSRDPYAQGSGEIRWGAVRGCSDE